MTIQDWREHARCRGIGPDLFFSERGEAQTQNTAMAICNGATFHKNDETGMSYKEGIDPCPVRDECLEFALGFDYDEDFGIFGGTTPGRRREIRKERTRVGATHERVVIVCRKCRGTGLYATPTNRIYSCACRDGLEVRKQAQ